MSVILSRDMLEGHPLVPVLISLSTAIAAIVILFVLRLKKPVRYAFERYAYASMGGLVLLGLTIPMFAGMSGLASRYFDDLTSRGSLFTTSVNTVYAVLIGAVFVLIARKSLFKGVSTKAFVLAAIVAGLCLKLAYVYLMDVRLVSDFRSMWKVVTEAITTGWPERVLHVHQQRALLFFFPLARLFGSAPLVYKIGNVGVLMLSSLLSFSLARRWFGDAAARASLFLILFIPETFFNLVIPSHDIPGAFLFLCSLWLLDTLLLSVDRKSWGACLITGLFLGISVEFLEIQRSTSQAFWMAVLIFIMSLASQAREIAPGEAPTRTPRFLNGRTCRILLFVLISFLVSKTANFLLESKGLILKGDGLTFDLIRGTDSWDKGEYSYQWKTYSPYLKKGNPRFSSMAVDKILSDIYYNPFDRIPNYLARSERLYALGMETGYYYNRSIQLPSSRLRGRRIEDFLTNHNTVFVLFFEMAFILSFVLMLVAGRIDPRTFPSLLTLSAVSTALLIFGESQPRYMYPIWFIAPMVMAARLGAPNGFRTDRDRLRVKENMGVFMRAALVFLAVACLLFSAVYVYARFSERRYLDMAEWTPPRANYRVDRAKSYFKRIQSRYEGQRHFRLTLGQARTPKKGDRVSSSHTYLLSDDAPRMFRVAVHPPYRAPRVSRAAEAFSALILINGRVVERSPLGTMKSAHWFEIGNIIPKGRKIKIGLAVETDLDAPDESWQELSLANFEFAQLMKQER